MPNAVTVWCLFS